MEEQRAEERVPFLFGNLDRGDLFRYRRGPRCSRAEIAGRRGWGRARLGAASWLAGRRAGRRPIVERQSLRFRLPVLQGEILVDLGLKLPHLLQRPLGENQEVARVFGERLGSIRFQDALHPAHLLDGLQELFEGGDHTFTRNMPFFLSGRCLTR